MGIVFTEKFMLRLSIKEWREIWGEALREKIDRIFTFISKIM